MARLQLAGLVLLAAGCSSPQETRTPLSRGDLGVCSWEELWIVERIGGARPDELAAGFLGNFSISGESGWAARDPATGEVVALPLTRTDMRADVVGRLATVAVRQRFENPFGVAVAGVYTFPLPSNAAVCDFVVTIGTRRIRAIVRESAEARRIYDLACAQGRLASLLREDSPGLFSQRVANIAPRSTLEASLEYVQGLEYEGGWCELALPLARRDDDHEVALEVSLDAGLPIEGLECSEAAAVVEAPAPDRRTLRLRDVAPGTRTELRLRYEVGSSETRAALLGADDADGGTFCLLVYPGAGGATGELAIDWGELGVRDVYTDPPAAQAEARVFLGRYRGGGGAIRLRTVDGRSLPLELRAKDFPARSLARTWARARIAALARQAAESADPAAATRCREEIRELALAHGLGSLLTSFVMVDARS